MAGKPRKKRNSNDSGEGGGGGGGGGKKKGGKKRGGGKSAKVSCDIFNDAAMENAYFVCHNLQDVLKSRGFMWPEAQKKKKKK